MHTPICDELDIEFPILRLYSLPRRRRGRQLTPEQLEIELKWIDENIGDHPYGVDIVIPNKYEGMDSADLSPEVLKKTLNDLVPQEHIDFAKKILADHGVPTDHSDDMRCRCWAGRRRPRHHRRRWRCSTRSAR